MPASRIYILRFTLLFPFFSLKLLGQADASVPIPKVDRSFKLLRDNEDWSFLRDSRLRVDVWDPIKHVSLGRNSPDRYLSAGGEVRQVWEQVGNDNWGQQPFMNGFWLQRFMFHVDIHYSKRVRSFVQLKSGVLNFRQGGARPIDKKPIDFEAAWLEFRTLAPKKWVALRVGRQELDYGSGRLISGVREGPNVRQSFDGFKLYGRLGEWRIDGFAFRPDLDRTGVFNNAPDHQILLWGVYSTRSLKKRVSADLYYVGLDRAKFTYNRGSARELRHSVAARLWRPAASGNPSWDFDYEGVWQFGSFGNANIRAWTLASDNGYSIPTVPLKPRLSIKADVSSGDQRKRDTLGTFSPIYPIGNYFGILADTGPGPVNFIDLHPRVQIQLPHSISISVDAVVQWRQSLEDGIYAVPGFLIRSSGTSRARFVGSRPGAEVRWQIDRHAYLQASYGIFYAGRFLKETMPGRNLNYWALWAGYKF